MYTSITKLIALALLVTPLVAALEVGGDSELARRYVGGNANVASMIVRDDDRLEARHHTEAQIAAKKLKVAVAARDLTQEEIEEDEDDALLTTLAPGGEIEARHHTEAQIAAKKAKAASRDLPKMVARHHTEAQIAAKRAKAAAAARDLTACHHTEAQIAAKAAKAAKSSNNPTATA